MAKHYWNAHQNEVVQAEIDNENKLNGYEGDTNDNDKKDWAEGFKEKLHDIIHNLVPFS